jgi:RimJ/RimL family protein N-acetyltransferase
MTGTAHISAAGRRPCGQRVELADGVRINVRPLERADRDAVTEMFGRLSERSRMQRFLGPKPTLTDSDLARFTRVDHRSHEALAAIDVSDYSIIAIARYVRSRAGEETAEVACEVVDDWQGHGVGRALSALLIERARASSIHKLTASTFSDNRAATALLRGCGFHTQRRSCGVSELELML